MPVLFTLLFCIASQAASPLKYFGAVTRDGYLNPGAFGGVNLGVTYNTSNEGVIVFPDSVGVNMITAEFDAGMPVVTINNTASGGSVPLPLKIDWTYFDHYLNYARTKGWAFQYYFWGGNQSWQWNMSSTGNVQAAWVDMCRQLAAHVGTTQIIYLMLVGEIITSGALTPSGSTTDNAAWGTGFGGRGTTGYDYAITAYKLARANLPPNFKLGINEASAEGVNGFNYAATQNLCRLLYSRGLLDWIGLEGYNMQLNFTDAQVQQALAAYASNFPKAEVHITEFTPTNGGPDPAGGLQEVLNYWQRFLINDFLSAPNVTAVSGPWWPTKSESQTPFGGAYINAYLIDDTVNSPIASPLLAWLRSFIPTVIRKLDPPFNLRIVQ